MGAEAEWLLYHARGQALEIGSAFGFSTICLADMAEFVTAIDPHETHDSLEQLLQHLAEYGVDHKVEILVKTSREAAPELADASYDIAFIDGDHRREGVLFDAEQAWRLVRSGGWIAFHDFGEDGCPDVAPAIVDFCRAKGVTFELVSDTTLAVISRP